MPRLKQKYYTPPTPPEERGREALIKFIDSKSGRYKGYSRGELAEKIGISPVALSNRMNKRAQFRHEEICKIICVLDATDEETLSFFGIEKT